MTYDAQLCEAITALGLPIEPNLDTSTETEYLVYSYTSEGVLYGDDTPCLDRRQWALVYVAPIGFNKIATRHSIREAVFNIFGDWPIEEDDSDASGQRYIYTFETIGGIDDGEPGNEQLGDGAGV